MKKLLILLLFIPLIIACNPFKSSTPTTITSFYSDSLTITNGTSTTLHWTVSGDKDTLVTISPLVGNKPLTGSVSIAPTVTTVYTLTATTGVYQISSVLTIVVK